MGGTTSGEAWEGNLPPLETDQVWVIVGVPYPLTIWTWFGLGFGWVVSFLPARLPSAAVPPFLHYGRMLLVQCAMMPVCALPRIWGGEVNSSGKERTLEVTWHYHYGLVCGLVCGWWFRQVITGG